MGKLFYQTFSKSDQLSIMCFLAYLEDKEGGFDRCNNEKVFASLREGDVSGRLFAEATRGFDFSKKYKVVGVKTESFSVVGIKTVNTPNLMIVATI